MVCFGWMITCISRAYSIHDLYVLCVFIGGVSPENPAPQEGVKRLAADDDSSPSPKKPRMDQ